MHDKRLVIITGHYGSGKTEFAVNYALKLKEQFSDVTIADLDIVNPYFRSREKRDLFEQRGIKVYDSNIKNQTIEIPALPPQIKGMINNQNTRAIIDLGGDPVGAKVIATYKEEILKQEYDLFFVINGNRPETKTKQSVVNYIQAIEMVSGLKVKALVNNTHMLKDTTVDDVILGHRLSLEVSQLLDVPIVYEVCIKEIASLITDLSIKEKLFPINLYMREEWMS